MGWLINKNLAQSTLASGYTAGNTTITVQAGDGSKFDAPGSGDTIALAIGNPPQFFLKATAVSTDTFTVDTSGFDGSTAISVSASTPVTQVITAQVLRDLLANAYTSGLPLSIIQEESFISVGNASSFTVTFPQAAQASGATMFCLLSCDGSASVGLPSGWTGDIDQAEATYARLVLCHKTSAGDTSATFTTSSSNLVAYFFEVEGSHALDQFSASGVANSALVALPSITPAAGAIVFGAVAFVTTQTAPNMTQSMNPLWKTVNLASNINGGRSLAFHVTAQGVPAVGITPPSAGLGAVFFFASGGVAYATFSIL